MSSSNDIIAWDKFATACKAKMVQTSLEGRRGWEDLAQCHVQDLATMLVECVDLVDIANMCMMVWNRGKDGYPLGEFDVITAYINGK